ncbi:MAG: hypothetical protein GF317_10155 [Candidatus Lokiarchaeota archaeon]|nr:hypothetical protein [Candidatus Lokiarchaeota archaeon]MBD3200022.1 hypothetical protein [Candidatus Lokiarchaeota archaeon]
MIFKNKTDEDIISCGFSFEDLHLDNDNRFHAIYFIDSLTGSLLLSNKFSNHSHICEADEDLIGSFLNAINLFINELNKNDKEEEQIQEINFTDSRILYERKGRLMVIGISKKTNLPIERKMLHNVLLDFYQKFEHKIEHFNGVIGEDILAYRSKLNELKSSNISEIKFRNSNYY